MRITITQDFDNAEEASAFLARVTGQSAEPVVTAAAGEGATVSPSPAASPADKPARKPRADRGQKREPYGPRATTTGEPAASEPGVAGKDSADPRQPAAPATPTTSSAPTLDGGDQKAVTPAPAPAAEESEFPATLDGARKAMKALNDTKGKGMDACIGALKAHGVNRISDLSSEKFADFIKHVLSQSSPEGIASAKAAAKPAEKK